MNIPEPEPLRFQQMIQISSENKIKSQYDKTICITGK